MNNEVVRFIKNKLKDNPHGIPVKEIRVDGDAGMDYTVNYWIATTAVIICSDFILEVSNGHPVNDADPFSEESAFDLTVISSFKKEAFPYVLKATNLLPIVITNIKHDSDDLQDEILLEYENCSLSIISNGYGIDFFVLNWDEKPTNVPVDDYEDNYILGFTQDNS